jgi:hypothetical protein
MSTASIISMPSLFCSRSFEPNCGRAAARITRMTAVVKRMNFSFMRPVEASGISVATVAGSPKRASRRRRS